MNGADVAAMGGNPFFFVKAGASYDDSLDKSIGQANQKTIKTFFKNFFALYIGMGLKLIEDNIYVKANVLK